MRYLVAETEGELVSPVGTARTERSEGESIGMVYRASDFEMRGSCKARLLAGGGGGGGQALACHLIKRYKKYIPPSESK